MSKLKPSIIWILAGLSISAVFPLTIQAQYGVDVKLRVNGGANVFYVGLPNTVEILVKSDLDGICVLSLPFKFDIGRTYLINTAYGSDLIHLPHNSAFKRHGALPLVNNQNIDDRPDQASPDTLYVFAPPTADVLPNTGGSYVLCYSASITVVDGEQPLANGVCVDNIVGVPCPHEDPFLCITDTGWAFRSTPDFSCLSPLSERFPPDYNGVSNLSYLSPTAPPICFDIVPAPAYSAASHKLPDAGCPPWTPRVLNGAPNPVLQGDTLVLNTTESAAGQLAYYEVVGSEFVRTGGPISIEFKMKYGSSTPGVPTRTSASVGISRGGRGNVLWIGLDKIFVWNGLDIIGESATVDTHLSYHVYRIEVDAGGKDLSVFQDGIRLLDGKLFLDASLWGATPTIYWGDATGNASGLSKWMYFKFNSTYPTCSGATCCSGLTGNVDCDPGDGADISDLSSLIDYLYITFTPLCCPAEANTDGQPGVDISDLSALIDYLYISFTPPALCQ